MTSHRDALAQFVLVAIIASSIAFESGVARV